MTEIVRKQYENWVYPVPVVDLDKYVEETFAYHDVTQLDPLIRQLDTDPDINTVLIAGCGTNQAAVHAFKSPDKQFTAVDISTNSLDHQNFLKEKYQLDNLELFHLDIRKIAKLKMRFDHVISTGVIHHFPDPVEPLKALRSAMTPEATLNCMVYGSGLRVGIYMLQDLFSTMGLKQTREDVEFVRYVIENVVQENHPAYRYIQLAQHDLKYDAGIVDTFLHPVDHSYTVDSLHQLLKDGGFILDQWITPWMYEPYYYFGAHQEVLDRLSSLPLQRKNHATDLLSAQLGTHRFIARQSRYAKKRQLTIKSIGHFQTSYQLHPLIQIDYQNPDHNEISCNGSKLGVIPDHIVICLANLIGRPFEEAIETIENSLRSEFLGYFEVLKRSGLVIPSYQINP
jgi:SAM-dependent methyltransferase